MSGFFPFNLIIRFLRTKETVNALGNLLTTKCVAFLDGVVPAEDITMRRGWFDTHGGIEGLCINQWCHGRFGNIACGNAAIKARTCNPNAAIFGGGRIVAVTRLANLLCSSALTIPPRVDYP